MEFGSYVGLGRNYYKYASQFLHPRVRGSRRQVRITDNRNNIGGIYHDYYRLFKYLYIVLSILRNQKDTLVNADIIESALKKIYPNNKIVGDKIPHYVYELNKYVNHKNLMPVIIYRDCRDVVDSTMKKVRTTWKNLAFSKNWDSPYKIAKKWVTAIEIMNKFQSEIHSIRYEDLVFSPENELKDLAKYLGVDASGFSSKIIYNHSVGNHVQGLTKAQLTETIEIAGPTMRKLGYF